MAVFHSLREGRYLGWCIVWHFWDCVSASFFCTSVHECTYSLAEIRPTGTGVDVKVIKWQKEISSVTITVNLDSWSYLQQLLLYPLPDKLVSTNSLTNHIARSDNVTRLPSVEGMCGFKTLDTFTLMWAWHNILVSIFGFVLMHQTISCWGSWALALAWLTSHAAVEQHLLYWRTVLG
jgi:hypothetical protein